MTELHELSALEQGESVRRREVSPVELAEHHLSRIDAIDSGEDTLGAFITVAAERALERARTLPEPPADASPLYGVPTAIKDLNRTAGVRTTFGSRVFADHVPETSDGVTLSIEEAGMVWLGKTNTPEFGSPPYTEPDVAPPAVTPWDRTRTAGGSSGGAGAAVAAGLVPVAQGSDGGGSIRIPASCCGLFGFKPSRGRVSGAPDYGDPIGLSTAGPLARTVRDAAALLDVLAGHRAGDPYWAPEPEHSFLSSCDREPGRLRVARFITPILSEVEVHPSSVTVWEETSALLEQLGHEVVDIEVPLPPEAVKVFATCWSVLTSLSVTSQVDPAALRPLTRMLSERGRATSAQEFGWAIGALRRVAARTLETLAPYDAVLTPTLATPPPKVGAIRNDDDPAADFAGQTRFTPWTSAWNVTGMPAVSLPLHWTGDGLPVGVMLAGRPGEDAGLFSLSAQLEAAAPWRHRTPPGW